MTFGHVTISFRNHRTMATAIVDATMVRMNHDRFRAGLRFLFFAPGATSGTWRQLAVVLGTKAGAAKGST